MIYFDNAATSRFKPFRSVIKQLYFTIKSSNPGRGAHKDAIQTALGVENAREILSEHFSGMRILFTKNCTEAICLAVRGLHLSGDALCSPYEHNAVLRTLEREQKNGLKMNFITPNALGKITEKEVLAALTPTTKLVVLTKMNNVTGETIDEVAIGSLLAARGILFLVDAAQATGHIHLDMKYVDMLTTSGHKGLHGPEGTGFLAIKEHIPLEPLLTGGTGSSTLSLKHPATYPDAYEAGTQAAANIIALGEAAKWTFRNFAKINKKITALSEQLYDGISKLPNIILYSVRGTPLISFNIKNKNSTEIADILSEKYNVAIRAGLHCAPLTHKFLGTNRGGTMRVSVGYCNHKYQVNRLLRILKKLSAI